VKEKGQPVKYETVIVDHGVEDKRQLVLEPELASAFEVMARKGNTLSPVMRQAWDNNNLGSLPKHDSMRATDPHISIVGQITAEELQHSLPAISLSNGLANRFLFICAKRSKYLPEGGKLSDEDRDKLADKLRCALESAAKLGRPGRSASATHRVELHHCGDVLARRRCRSALQLDAGPARDVPDRELADQVRLVEAIAFAFGREIGQAIQNQSSLCALADLPLDRLNSPPSGCLRRRHAGGREWLHRYRETVRKCDVERCLVGAQIQHRPSWSHDA
jgi:hypothetical protein